MEEEVRHILRDAVKTDAHPVVKLGSRIAARFAKVGLTAELQELQGQASQPRAAFCRSRISLGPG
jgi:hypothetical protein